MERISALEIEFRKCLELRGISPHQSVRLAQGHPTSLYRRLAASARGTLDVRGFWSLVGLIPDRTEEETARLILAFVEV